MALGGQGGHALARHLLHRLVDVARRQLLRHLQLVLALHQLVLALRQPAQRLRGQRAQLLLLLLSSREQHQTRPTSDGIGQKGEQVSDIRHARKTTWVKGLCL